MERGITLIGMSNVGKSWWREKFARSNYKTVCCDDLIEQKLAPFLQKQGFSGIRDVAKWMGYPFDPQYQENSALYLRCENEVMEEILERLSMGRKLVVDTTGSVIYTEPRIRSLIQLHSNVVLLDTSCEAVRDLCERYVLEPKPVIWSPGTYSPFPGEDPIAALGRCYPDLLFCRREAYLEMAHRILDYELFRSPGFRVQDFVRLVS